MSSARHTIHMKFQALFSQKKVLRKVSASVVNDTVRVMTNLSKSKASFFSQSLLLRLRGVGVSLVFVVPLLQYGFSFLWHFLQLPT